MDNSGVEITHLESVQLFLKNFRIVSKTFKARELSCGSDISFSPTTKSRSSDGTLITQRLHFAQGVGTNPHVLGWYRIAKELNDNGVSATCVFDGKSRSLAKAREASSPPLQR